LGQTHCESFWKKIQLILQFFGGTIHQENLYQKKNINMYINKKTLVVVVVVILGFRRIGLDLLE
jgi:hypothetical protein